jgi:hypothetical protein
MYNLTVHEDSFAPRILFVAQGVTSCFSPFMKTERKLSHSSWGSIGR